MSALTVPAEVTLASVAATGCRQRVAAAAAALPARDTLKDERGQLVVQRGERLRGGRLEERFGDDAHSGGEVDARDVCAPALRDASRVDGLGDRRDASRGAVVSRDV